MKNKIFIAMALIVFVYGNDTDTNASKYAHYHEYKKSLIALDKRNEQLRSNQQNKNIFLNDANYFNRWIKIPYIKNSMKIDNVYIPEILNSMDEACRNKKTYLGVVHLTHFKIVPYNEKDIGKFIAFKAKIIKTFSNSTKFSRQKEITFFYILRFNDTFQADLSSDNIVLLEEEKNNLYINPYLILAPKKELVNAVEKHFGKSKKSRDELEALLKEKETIQQENQMTITNNTTKNQDKRILKGK